MNYKAKIIAKVKNMLKQYGIHIVDEEVDIVDIGPDNVSLIVRRGGDAYFLTAKDHLSNDETHMTQAENKGITGLAPLKLLKKASMGSMSRCVTIL